jgi:hypothetical protein
MQAAVMLTIRPKEMPLSNPKQPNTTAIFHEKVDKIWMDALETSGIKDLLTYDKIKLQRNEALLKVRPTDIQKYLGFF